MSLGALDFGIIVDGAVVIIENAVRRLAHAPAASRPAADALRALRTKSSPRPRKRGGR